MRTVDLLRLAAALLSVAAAVLMASRRRLVRRFERGHAFDEPDAIALVPPPAALDAWWQSRLERAGVLRHREDGRRWIDRDAWHRYRAARRTRATLTVTVLLIALGAFFFMTGGR